MEKGRSSAPQAGIPQPLEDLDARESEIYELYLVKRWTMHAIGQKMGISQQRVSQIVKEMREKLPPVDIAAQREASLAMYRDIAKRAYEIADLDGAPMTAGKDGDVVVDPETNRIVRDYGGRLAALKEARAADEQIRRLMGLDAAQKVESTSTVRYEIVGIDPEDLK